jgi:PKD repeat protein
MLGAYFDDPTSATPEVTFPDNGTANVCLTVYDGSGANDEECTSITVLNVPPTCGAINLPAAPVEVNTLIPFSSSFTDLGIDDVHTAEWDWDYPNADTEAGTVDQGAGSGSVWNTHAFTAPGSYQVQLTVDDGDGGMCVVQSDFLVVVDIPVAVDIKPGSDPNCFKVGKKGVTPVAILATADFDPTTVDPATVTLGPGVPNDVSPIRWSLNKDVNRDGAKDLVFHFSTPEMEANGLLTEGDTLILIGELKEEFGGLLFGGLDVIHLAGGPVCLGQG